MKEKLGVDYNLVFLVTDKKPPMKRVGFKFVCSAKEDERILFIEDNLVVTNHRLVLI